MTSSIFIDLVKNEQGKKKNSTFDQSLSVHPPNIPGLTNFLPVNCTCKLQPLDMGIICSTKAYYQKSLIRKLSNFADKKELEQFTILEAMHMIISAQKEVSSHTIENCFGASGIGIEEQLAITNAQLDTEDITTKEWKSLVGDEDVSLKDYINCDKDILTDFRNLDQIYEAITNENAT